MSAKKFFYVMIGFILLSLIGLGGAFVFGGDKLKSKASSISDLMAEKDFEQDKKIALEKASRSIDDKDKLVSLIDTLLPQKKEQEALIVDIIYTATSEAGIRSTQISSFSFSGGAQPDDLSGTEKSEDIGGVYSYPFTLQLQNIPYTTLLVFLQEIESNSRIVQVSDIQITPDKSSTSGSLSSVTLSLKAYLKP